jgi:ABC-type sugar transport system ATPase subunit
VDREKLISLMVGRKTLKYIDRSQDKHLAEVEPILEVRNLSDAERVKDVSFQLRPGEIVALAGLAGAGRTEMALAVFGASPRKSGEILVNGKKVNITSPQDAIRAGLGYLPEDRRSAGLFLEMAISQNIASAKLEHFGKVRLSSQRMTQVANEFRQKLSIAAPSVSIPVQNLSGGNQQKVVISRWLLVSPKILIVDEPTRGIDVGAKAEVHSLLEQLARQGAAILLISSELPEVLSVADRILVMCEGRISGELDGQTATEEDVLHLASAFEPH